MSLKKILIAVDDSPHSRRAREIGVEIANATEAEIAFVYVFDATATPAGAWGFAADRISAMSQLEGKRLLDKFLEGLEKQPSPRAKVREFLESGNPAETIVRVAKKWSANLIVMGSRGRGKMTGILLGSVSQDVLCNAPCPVLVAPPES
jgi:nucleotide-binding universal stress UspA family protein